MHFKHLPAPMLAVLWLATAVAAVEPDAKIAPVQELDGIQAKRLPVQATRIKEPLVIRTADEARAYFDEANLKKLTEKIDFAQQLVLVFAWRGSGQDRLEWSVAESYPEQATFKLVRGRTKDLRPHLKIYALRSNVTWTQR